MKQLKRRGFKKRKRETGSSGKGGGYTMPAIFLLLCLFLSEKKTMPPRKRRVEDACAPKRGEAPEKEKEDGKTAKKQMSVSLNVISLLVFFFL